MANEILGPFTSEIKNNPFFELEDIKNEWIRQAKTLPTHKYQDVQSQINATAKKIETLFSTMKEKGALPEEIRQCANKQFAIFNNTCENLIQNQKNFQKSKGTLKNSLNQFDDKINKSNLNSSPLRLESKKQTSTSDQKDEFMTHHFGDKEQLKTCLVEHSCLKSEYYKEKGITKTVAELGAEKFANSNKSGSEVQKGALEIVKVLQVLPEGESLRIGNEKLNIVRSSQLEMATEKALKDCSNFKIESFKTFHYPDKKKLQTCLLNHPVLKTEDYEKNGITKTVAALGSEEFADSEKYGLGVQLGAMNIVDDLQNQPAGKCLKTGDIYTDSKNTAKMILDTERVLVDCSTGGK